MGRRAGGVRHQQEKKAGARRLEEGAVQALCGNPSATVKGGARACQNKRHSRLRPCHPSHASAAPAAASIHPPIHPPLHLRLRRFACADCASPQAAHAQRQGQPRHARPMCLACCAVLCSAVRRAGLLRVGVPWRPVRCHSCCVLRHAARVTHHSFIYMTTHFFFLGFFCCEVLDSSAVLMASSNTVLRPVCVRAEHSR